MEVGCDRLCPKHISQGSNANRFQQSMAGLGLLPKHCQARNAVLWNAVLGIHQTDRKSIQPGEFQVGRLCTALGQKPLQPSVAEGLVLDVFLSFGHGLKAHSKIF